MIVLDASALLALLLEEPGADVVRPLTRESHISAVNLGEVLSKYAERGGDPDALERRVLKLGVRVRSFRSDHARAVAALRPLTQHLGLSFGDRACLVQARFGDMPAYTADRKWAQLDLGIDVRLIR